MSSLILSAASRFLLPILLMFSLLLLFRGHHLPGGGFVGGLVAATAFALYGIAHGIQATYQILKIDPVRLMGVGLSLALLSGLFALTVGEPFMSGLWSGITLPVLGKLGTPLFFDMGVYLVVLGATMTILFALMEE